MNPAAGIIICVALVQAVSAASWTRHTIDDSSRGADGVRLHDADGDGLLDIVTGWEEGGVVRLYKNPGAGKAREKWPTFKVGSAPNVEDAVMADLDGDGFTDVISSSEGKTRTMFVHWGTSRDLKKSEWKTEAVPASVKSMMWMFALPMQIDGRHGLEIFAGGKGEGAELGWWEAPARPRQLSDWRWHRLREVGWLMSLASSDMDGDGDLDLVFSDRKGPRTGCFWLENPGTEKIAGPWVEHAIGAGGSEAMFLSLGDVDGDGLQDVVVAVKPKELLFLRRLSRDGQRWQTERIQLPENSGNAKAVSIGDLDLDGRADLVFTCEGADKGKSGVMWLSKDRAQNKWLPHDISGPDGIKHDLAPLLDLDGDGDLDVITCEETKNLVFWYEKPLRR
jgi:hypothetical protein